MINAQIPVLEALEQRRVTLPIERGLDSVMAMNVDISSKFS